MGRAWITGMVCVVVSVGAAAVATPPATTRPVATGLKFPVAVAGLPGAPVRLLVLERAGRIAVVTPGTGEASTFLDFSAAVCCADGDGGAQGLALAPDYETSGEFYVCSTAAGTRDSTVTRYTVSADPLVADAGSAHAVFHYPRPEFGHEGGWIGFGPIDGMLYISTGDGGEALNPDPLNAAQTIVDQKMGKVLRIDVRADAFPADATQNYAIPAGNPFVGVMGDDEIWAYGLRNPWRCAFDANGDFYIADVGQEAWEEIDFEGAGTGGGRNYGWRCMEGTGCTGLSGCACDGPTLTAPVHEYGHDLGCSITGGVVYRGGAIPAYVGRYFYGDFCTGRFWSLRMVGGAATDVREHTGEMQAGYGAPIGWIVAFGTDSAGEMYVLDHYAGVMHAVVPRCFCDFDANTFVNGDDFDAFSTAFYFGNTSADVDENTFVNGDDFDAFMGSFFAGC